MVIEESQKRILELEKDLSNSESKLQQSQTDWKSKVEDVQKLLVDLQAKNKKMDEKLTEDALQFVNMKQKCEEGTQALKLEISHLKGEYEQIKERMKNYAARLTWWKTMPEQR